MHCLSSHWRIHEYLRVSELQAVTVSARVCTIARAMISIQIPLFGIYKHVVEQMQSLLNRHYSVLSANIDELIDPNLYSRDENDRAPKAVRNETIALLDQLRINTTTQNAGREELPTTDQLDELYQALKSVTYQMDPSEIFRMYADICLRFY